MLNVSHNTVLKHLKHCGIERRDLSSSHFAKNGKEFPKELTDYETLYDMYVLQKMSKKEIALNLNVTPHVVDRCLHEFNIKVRGSSEAKKGLVTGEKHPNWKGGRTTLYMRLREYFYGNQGKKARKRDGYKCQMCGSKNNLQVHHIRPFKNIFDEILSEHHDLDVQKNNNELYDIMTKDERMNDMDNLITYCKECHLFKVHGYKKKNITKQMWRQ